MTNKQRLEEEVLEALDKNIHIETPEEIQNAVEAVISLHEKELGEFAEWLQKNYLGAGFNLWWAANETGNKKYTASEIITLYLNREV